MEHARKLEARRIRTRNSLIHGGPLAPRTVAVVAPFAANLASEALGASLEGRLVERDLVEHFLDRQARLASMRGRLQAGQPAADVLFSEVS
jgi:hypothetical protein